MLRLVLFFRSWNGINCASAMSGAKKRRTSLTLRKKRDALGIINTGTHSDVVEENYNVSAHFVIKLRKEDTELLRKADKQ